jgi:hypothetical protein
VVLSNAIVSRPMVPAPAAGAGRGDGGGANGAENLFLYVDRLEPEFVPAALAFGSGIHGAAAFLFRGLARGARPSAGDVQGYFESVWNLEAAHRPLRFGEKDTKDSLLDLGSRMLAVLCDRIEPPASRWSPSRSRSRCR